MQALDQVSLTLAPGMFGLLGPNGAGESTLMRTLSRQSPTVVDLAVLRAFAFIAGLRTAAAGSAIEGARVSFGSEKIFTNSPYAVAQGITIFGLTGVMIIAAMMGRSVPRDFEHGTCRFFFTAPIAKRDDFFGGFIGAYLTLCLIFAGIAIGLIVGSQWPGVNAEHVAPFSLESYVRPYLFTLLPNLLWLGGLFFVIAALTRQIAPVYIAGVVVLIGYLLSVNLITESLAGYSTLMVLKQRYADAKMKRFFKYELDRYLGECGAESKAEQPLFRADGAAYVHYRKGCLALYAFQDAIGEDAMNKAWVHSSRSGDS